MHFNLHLHRPKKIEGSYFEFFLLFHKGFNTLYLSSSGPGFDKENGLFVGWLCDGDLSGRKVEEK